jgi:Ca2+/Na+ antiporter
MISPLAIEPKILSVDFPVMFGVFLLLVLLLTMLRPRLYLGRWRGLTLLAGYALFTFSLFIRG